MATLDRELHNELVETIEDMVEYWCDANMMSGELAWVVVECLAKAKVAQLQGKVQ